MNIIETIRTALDSLASNKLRTALTMLGVIIGVASVVTLLALGTGVQKYIGGQLQGLGTNVILINPSDAPGARLTVDDMEALADRARLPGVLSVVPEIADTVEVGTETFRKFSPVHGTTPEFARQNSVKMASGRWLNEEENEGRVRVVVLGSTLARQLFKNTPALMQAVLINGAEFEVVGVAAPKGGLIDLDVSAYVPFNVASEKLFPGRPGGTRGVTSIAVETAPGTKLTAASRDITRLLRTAKNVQAGQRDPFTLFEPTSLVSSFNTITTALTTFLGAIGAISLLVGGIGIMNIMLVSVTERTREIGVRKAIGASPISIRVQFLIEAVMVTCLAGLLGIALAVSAVALVGITQSQFQPVVEFRAIAIAFGVSVFIGVLFGFYPAFRASRLQPVEALRYE